MSESIVSSVVQTLTDLLKEEAKFLAGVDGQVQGIPHELKMMQMQGKLKTTVRTWVEGDREVAYHAEDVLETLRCQSSIQEEGRHPKHSQKIRLLIG